MSIYSQNILEHYKSQKNKWVIKNADHVHENINRSCWDEITIYIKVNKKEESIEEIKFEWHWCAISMWVASMISEELVWLKIEDVEALWLNDIEDIVWIKIWANRIKCALLAIDTIKKALQSKK